MEEEERRQLVSATNDPKDRSATSSFIWRGLRLGKKVALAGAAISTVPVVIPPLVVGLAFAFPFGVYIAGVTYTDRVMRALLSTPPDLVMPDGRDEEEEDIEIWPPTATLIETSARQIIVFSGDDEVPGGMVEGGKAKKEAASTEKGHDEVDGDELAPVTADHDIELWPPISDLHIPREEGNNIEGPGTGGERCVEEARDRTLDIYNTEQDANIKFDYSSPINRNEEDMLRDDITTLGEEMQMQIERGAEKNQERRQREEKEIQGLNTDEHALSASGAGTEAVVACSKEMNGTDDEVEMNRQDGMGRQIESNYVVTTVECKHVVEQSAVDRNRIERGVETLGQAVESEKDEGGVMGERNTGNEENVTAIYHSLVSVAPLESESESESERERVPSNLTSEYASAVEDQYTGMTDNVSGPTAIIVETARVVNFDNEVLYSEEMIWEQIYAMRTIVGYKSALNSSLVEELMALYLFTGVEPPISLRDTSDVMEIGDKLDFLKSVIGVK